LGALAAVLCAPDALVGSGQRRMAKLAAAGIAAAEARRAELVITKRERALQRIAQAMRRGEREKARGREAQRRIAEGHGEEEEDSQ